MTLYLCKTDPNQRIAGRSKLIGVVGVIVCARDIGADKTGYRFIPRVAGRKASRKIWHSAYACIPRWAHQVGYCELLDKTELDAAIA